MSRPFRIVLAGYGTVGRALHEMIDIKREELAQEAGVRPEIVGICRSAGGWRAQQHISMDKAAGGAEAGLTVDDLLEDEHEVDCLVELTPTDLMTGGAGVVHCRTALSKGIHVVTANKGPVVLAHRELTALAQANDARFRFEATAGAAMPLMNLKDHCLRGDAVHRLEGILNGTCNYILTRMGEEGLDLEQALHEAQALGYAEADPTADVEGHDAAAKVVILGNHYFDLDLSLDDVDVTGIGAVTGEAVQLAHKQGFAVRLVASVDRSGDAEVAPRLVPLASPLNVHGTLNLVRLHAQNAGPITISGRGAGGRETAAAVLSDLLNIAVTCEPRRRAP